jgi:hypothetical protein
MKVFKVIKQEPPMPWTVQHVPTGLNAGSFHYRAHALTAAASLEVVAVEYPEFADPANAGRYSTAAMDALMEARKAHTDADRAQAIAAEAKRKRTKVQP